MLLWKLFLVGLTGLPFCDTFHVGIRPYEYHHVKVAVVDDETERPLANAKVSISYSDSYVFNKPKPDSAVTDGKGVATVKAAIGTSDWWVFCNCKGYCDSCSSVGVPQLAVSDQHHLALRLTKAPVVTVVVPNGYRGAIKFSFIVPSSTIVLTRNKRVRPKYVFRANEKGEVNIDSAEDFPALEYVLCRSYLTARYENGKQIPSDNCDKIRYSTLAFRHVAMWYPALKTKQNLAPDDVKLIQAIYVIGTAQDRKTLYDSLPGVERIGVSFDFDFDDNGTDDFQPASLAPLGGGNKQTRPATHQPQPLSPPPVSRMTTQ